MSESHRPDPLAAAQRVKDLARDLARDVAGELADGYRRSSRYVRLRAVIAGTFAALSLFAMWASCLPAASNNALGAEAQLLADSIMGTQLLVKNDSERNWTQVAFTLDGEWRLEKRTVRAGDKLVVPLAQFARGGEPAPEGLRPTSLEIRCAEGRVTAPLAGR
jgi:hypothetical protein